MQIQKIFIATHKHDLRLTRICVASIRYWYPDVPIYLIKDYLNGDFSTREIEQFWDVKIFETERKMFGWGFSKLEPFFQNTTERFLILDSDIVFVGRVLDYLNEFESDFVVQLENKEEAEIAQLYFSLTEMKTWDPLFRFPNYTFNSGQLVGTAGVVSRRDFESLLNWNNVPITLKHPHVFTMGGDQGLLNYVLLKKASAGKVTIDRVPFMRWGLDEIRDIDLSLMIKKSPYRFLIHWAGLKRNRMSSMIRSDILKFFENYYYTKIRFGHTLKRYRVISCLTTLMEFWIRRQFKGLKRRTSTLLLSLVLHGRDAKETKVSINL